MKKFVLVVLFLFRSIHGGGGGGGGGVVLKLREEIKSVICLNIIFTTLAQMLLPD